MRFMIGFVGSYGSMRSLGTETFNHIFFCTAYLCPSYGMASTTACIILNKI